MAYVTKEEVKSFVRAVRIEMDARYAAKFATNSSVAVVKSDLNSLADKVDDINIDTDNFVEKEEGKVLSSNDFTDADKQVIEELRGNASFDTSDVADIFDD